MNPEIISMIPVSSVDLEPVPITLVHDDVSTVQYYPKWLVDRCLIMPKSKEFQDHSTINFQHKSLFTELVYYGLTKTLSPIDDVSTIFDCIELVDLYFLNREELLKLFIVKLEKLRYIDLHDERYKLLVDHHNIKVRDYPDYSNFVKNLENKLIPLGNECEYLGLTTKATDWTGHQEGDYARTLEIRSGKELIVRANRCYNGWNIYNYKVLLPFVEQAYKRGIIRLDEESLKLLFSG